MELKLPPGLSARQFEAGLQAFQSVVGSDWVLASDLDRDTYADVYSPGPEEDHAPAAAVAPADTEQVRALVRLANEHRIPLWPISRGKNLGYGAAAPRMPGTVVIDLGRMRKILEVDPRLGYCVVEPGVSFFDLHEHIVANDMPLWMSVPGNAWGSVMGNALERGFGYTNYGQHTRNICGMEVVLPDGDLVRTGMGALEGGQAWHLFPYGFGPSWDQMFVQSSLGIVTKMGLWLAPEPEASLSLSMAAPHEEDIGWIVETIQPLRMSGLITQSQFVPSWLGKMSLMGQRSQFYTGPGAMPDEVVQKILKDHGLGYWSVNVRFYDNEKVNAAKAEVVKQAFAKHTDQPFTEHVWRRGDPVVPMDPSFGVPSAVPLQMANWTGGRGGHLGFSPVVPPTKEHVLGQLKRTRERFAQFGFDFYASFTIQERYANNIAMILYDRDDPEQVKRTREMFPLLVEDARKAGYGEYRTHLTWMDTVAGTFDFNDHAQRRLNEKVKDALDPNGILSPGKQGVWPKAYRSQRA